MTCSMPCTGLWGGWVEDNIDRSSKVRKLPGCRLVPLHEARVQQVIQRKRKGKIFLK